MIALGSVAAVTALDLVCALQMTRNARQAKHPVRDYSARSGFPHGIGASFGIALREMREGLDWWDSWRRNMGRGGSEALEFEGRGREERHPSFEERREFGPPAGRA
jgi:hypothetical protein